MQFITNGPNIPNSLLALHEEGKVVFFCGAGISYDAGLPTFSGLTDKLYEELGEPKSDVEFQLIDEHKYDLAINLLEGRTIGGRYSVRMKLAKILTPDPQVYSDVDAMTVHNALLSLSQDREGQCKLVTTNFDRIFEKLIEIKHLDIPSEVAPHLPLPKKGRWNSLVYLHGQLPKDLNESVLNRLVISSGDFGLAYLIERWASRFVAELFRNYTVCFVGYSINDPVMRYMMDALAADKLLGGSSPDMYAFMSYKNDEEKESLTREWNAKNVIPILYHTKSKYDHQHLKNTLHSWANIYRDGVLGKEQIIVRYAATKPSESTEEDDFINRVLWALSDSSGVPAKRFSELEPTPSLDWLEVITDKLLTSKDKKNIVLVSNRDDFVYPLSKQYRYIARWLSKYIHDPELLLWIAKYGGKIHPEFLRYINDRLSSHTPPQSMLKLWQIILSERLETITYKNDIYDWFEEIKDKEVSLLKAMQLRDVLQPLVKFKKPFVFQSIPTTSSTDTVKSHIDWEIVLRSSHVSSAIEHGGKHAIWSKYLPILLPVFSNLLIDVLNIMHTLDEADEKFDVSHWHHPSIEKHEQNHGFKEWEILIELTRDAWLETLVQNPSVAKLEVLRWQTIRYPLFRRFTFFAVANSTLFTTKEIIDWLLEDNHYWLWVSDTKREVMRLLVSLATQLQDKEKEKIEKAILAGPPMEMYQEGIEAEQLTSMRKYAIWLRLKKIHQSGLTLSQEAEEMLKVISNEYPHWALSDDKREEFSTWMSSGFEGGDYKHVPRSLTDLKVWIKQEKEDYSFERDDWEDFTSRYFLYSSKVLRELAEEDNWNSNRWSTALYAWSRNVEKKKLIYQSWSTMGHQLLQATDDFLKEIAHSLTYWLEAIAPYSLDKDEDLFFALTKRLLEIYKKESTATDTVISGDQVTRAINHPVGNIVKAILLWWKRKTLKDNISLDEPIATIFTDICNSKIPIFYYGQLIIATDTIALFRVDKDWSRKHLLPLFNWNQSEATAPGVWKGLLWSPRLYKELFKEIKKAFLNTAKHCDVMEDFGKQYASLLTFAAIESEEIFTVEELANATRLLTSECLEDAANSFVDLLSSTTEKKRYWDNRLYPYLQNIWPKDTSFLTDEIVNKFALLCVNSGDIFPEVFSYVKIWLRVLDNDPHYILYKMKENNICKIFPEVSLDFLDTIIDQNLGWSGSKLKECLDMIIEYQSTLSNTSTYQRLVQETII